MEQIQDYHAYTLVREMGGGYFHAQKMKKRVTASVVVKCIIIITQATTTW